MLIAVRAEVENVNHWREQFKTHNDLFKSQGVSLAYMGSLDEDKVLAVFETNDPATAKAMENDKITGGVELFMLDETFIP